MRHGEVNYHRKDGRTEFSNQVELTTEGEEQARHMAQMLADVPFDVAVHTGLPRTRATLELVLAGREVPVVEMPDLKEMQGGKIEGLTAERLEAEFVYGLERAALPGASFAGGETFAAFQHRVVMSLEHLLFNTHWTTMLAVAHGGTNAMILSWITNGGLASLAAFEQDAGCVNILDIDVIDGEIIRKFIRALNVTPYNLAKREHYLTVTERIAQGARRMNAPTE